MGGHVREGIAIYHFLRGLPIHVTTYNAGTTQSIAVVVFLESGEERKATPFANFMTHMSRCHPMPMSAEHLAIVLQSVQMDDFATDSIIREHTTLTDAQWERRKRTDLFLSADEALACGLITEIGSFRPEDGSPIFNISA